MALLLIFYFLYLLLYVGVSYAIIFHLVRYRVEGDISQIVLVLYLVLSVALIIGSILLLRPA